MGRGKRMRQKIPKFERDLLLGGNIIVRKGTVTEGTEKHWHNYYEILCYVGCEGYCIINGERFEIDSNKPCLFLVTPKDFHEIVMTDRPDSYALNITFSELMIDKRLEKESMIGPVVLYLKDELLHMLIKDILRVYEGKSLYRELQLKHLFNDILIRVLEEGTHTALQNVEIHPIVREGIAYMLRNLSEPVTLSDISKRFGVSETYFSHLFKDSLGVSFKQYQLSKRIDYAKRMLEEQELPILAIGNECGFNTPAQFNRVFKEKTGLTPSQYRKKQEK